jgi:hypothetical protein
MRKSSTRVQLAAGDIAPQISLSVWLIKDRVEILWPSRSTVASASTYPELISAVTRLLSNSVLELARRDAAEKRG